jgi:opacity protein-like surface antigen
MKKLVFAAVAAAFLAAPALAADSPAEGAWAIEAKTDFGTFTSDWTVAEEGGAWAIEMKDAPMAGMDGPPPESTISNLKIDGSKVTFDRALDMGGQKFSMSYDLTVDGDTLSGTARSDFGPIPISGTRK